MMLAWAGAPGPVRLVPAAEADAHDAGWGGAYGWCQQRLLLIMLGSSRHVVMMHNIGGALSGYTGGSR